MAFAKERLKNKSDRRYGLYRAEEILSAQKKLLANKRALIFSVLDGTRIFYFSGIQHQALPPQPFTF